MWPIRVLRQVAVRTSHRRMVLSSEAETRKRESEEKARSETPCSWPVNFWRGEGGVESELEILESE